MKYIRTVDGRIIDTTSYPDTPASFGIQARDYALTEKEANTIEDLCDEFVFASDLSHYVIKDASVEHCKKTTLEILNEDETFNLKQYHPIIYGAIWTSKGLIYVAKMNNEGNLELI